ncbi:hypothetical protein BUALT_Bualt02G0232400 [Buddleja alternifolia]|uniref:Uncharacterized protein n=1 Tax=Buddleja alternifolia TaxID=168488 RepID=A0AAV6YAL2_9LAMI|nr:hypothetical protein BUALT_Bualt02G0232400 [Buddleja alternifolia]
MENGEGNLESKFSELTVSDAYNINGNDGLFQVMKAVEAAEATIKQQVEENNRLRSELQKKSEELEKYKSGDLKYQNPQSGDRWVDHVNEPCRADQIVLRLGNQIGGIGNMDISSGHGLSNSVILQEDVIRSNKDHAMHTDIENQFDRSKVNGSLKVIHGDEMVSDNSGIPQFVSPSITLFSPNRYLQEDNSDSEHRISGRGLISMAEVNNHSSSKQDLVVKIREHEEEILHLKKHLTEFSVKEAQICNEKYALEKRMSYLRLAFDQQQQDLVLAASKAISYRQDIMEENVRLTYALQAAQQERSMFVSSLMPLLAEYSLQPPVADAQSIVSNVKVLFRHLQEQLLVTEGKLKESHYQLAPWRSDVNPSNFAQTPLYPIEIKKGLELLPQPAYSDGNRPFPDPQTAMDGDILGHHQGLDGARNFEHDELGRHPPFASRNTAAPEVPFQLAFSQTDPHLALNNEETISKKVTFGDLVRSSDMVEPDFRGHQTDRGHSENWTSKASATTNLDDPNSYSPYLPPVLEEPSSSFSEAADDDPLPAIEGLQISGEAFLGQQLQACGYSINGTTSCNFEWVRHLEDGSFNYVDGAKQPNYLVTADDVDTYLAIEVQPLDDRKRKGELVKVFANEHRKITCDPEMHNCIEKTLYTGHASYKLSLSTGYLDLWEPATLAIKRDGYSIKCSGPSGVVVTEKFSPSIIVSIPYGSPTELSIVDSGGIERILRVESSLTDISG